MTQKFLSVESAPLFVADSSSKKLLDMLWGDQLTVLQAGATRSKVWARGKTG